MTYTYSFSKNRENVCNIDSLDRYSCDMLELQEKICLLSISEDGRRKLNVNKKMSLHMSGRG